MTGYPLVISEEVKEEKNVLIQTYALSYNSEVLVSFFVVVESVSSIYFPFSKYKYHYFLLSKKFYSLVGDA